MKNEILDEPMDQAELNFAGFGLRFFAYLIDIIPIVILVNLFAYFIFGLNPFDSVNNAIKSEEQNINESNTISVIIRYVSFLVWIAYCAVMEGSTHQGTFGKKMIGIKVVDENGRQLTLKKSTARNASKILSYAIVGLGFIWALFDKQKRAWHDILAKTFVTKTDG